MATETVDKQLTFEKILKDKYGKNPWMNAKLQKRFDNAYLPELIQKDDLLYIDKDMCVFGNNHAITNCMPLVKNEDVVLEARGKSRRLRNLQTVPLRPDKELAFATLDHKNILHVLTKATHNAINMESVVKDKSGTSYVEVKYDQERKLVPICTDISLGRAYKEGRTTNNMNTHLYMQREAPNKNEAAVMEMDTGQEIRSLLELLKKMPKDVEIHMNLKDTTGTFYLFKHKVYIGKIVDPSITIPKCLTVGFDNTTDSISLYNSPRIWRMLYQLNLLSGPLTIYKEQTSYKDEIILTFNIHVNGYGTYRPLYTGALFMRAYNCLVEDNYDNRIPPSTIATEYLSGISVKSILCQHKLNHLDLWKDNPSTIYIKNKQGAKNNLVLLNKHNQLIISTFYAEIPTINELTLFLGETAGLFVDELIKSEGNFNLLFEEGNNRILAIKAGNAYLLPDNVYKTIATIEEEVKE